MTIELREAINDIIESNQHNSNLMGSNGPLEAAGLTGIARTAIGAIFPIISAVVPVAFINWCIEKAGEDLDGAAIITKAIAFACEHLGVDEWMAGLISIVIATAGVGLIGGVLAFMLKWGIDKLIKHFQQKTIDRNFENARDAIDLIVRKARRLRDKDVITKLDGQSLVELMNNTLGIFGVSFDTMGKILNRVDINGFVYGQEKIRESLEVGRFNLIEALRDESIPVMSEVHRQHIRDGNKIRFPGYRNKELIIALYSVIEKTQSVTEVETLINDFHKQQGL